MRFVVINQATKQIYTAPCVTNKSEARHRRD